MATSKGIRFPLHSTCNPHMKPLRLYALVLALSAPAFTQCSTTKKIVSDVSDLGGLIGGEAPPESQWNALRIWKKASDSPLVYIPSDYPVTAPRSESSGSFFLDKRDGKRLFVPHQFDGSFSPAVLRGEAKKLTDQ